MPDALRLRQIASAEPGRSAPRQPRFFDGAAENGRHDKEETRTKGGNRVVDARWNAARAETRAVLGGRLSEHELMGITTTFLRPRTRHRRSPPRRTRAQPRGHHLINGCPDDSDTGRATARTRPHRTLRPTPPPPERRTHTAPAPPPKGDAKKKRKDRRKTSKSEESKGKTYR